MRIFYLSLVAALWVSTASAQAPQVPEMSDAEIEAIADNMTDEEYEAEMERARQAVNALSPAERAQAKEGLMKMMETMSEEEQKLMYEHHPLLQD